MNTPNIILAFVTAVLFVLFFFGLIGPKWLKNRIRKFNTWAEKDGAVFFPIDPYKPIGIAVREGLRNSFPITRHKRLVAYALIVMNGLLILAMMQYIQLFLAYTFVVMDIILIVGMILSRRKPQKTHNITVQSPQHSPPDIGKTQSAHFQK
jgi:hypothetical protein